MAAIQSNRFSLLVFGFLYGLVGMRGGMLLGIASAPSGTPPSVLVVYFYSPTCMKCREVHKQLNRLEQHYGQALRVERHDISTDKGIELMFRYEDQYGVTEGAPPKIFVGTFYLGEAEAIQARLEEIIRNELAHRASPSSNPATNPNQESSRPASDGVTTSPASYPPPSSRSVGAPMSSHESYLAQRFQSFQLTAVLLAGLIDGVNPCAFATIVFLVSALTYFGMNRHKIAVVGITFTLSVFFTYLLLGLGLMFTIKTFAVETGISRILVYIVAALTFLLAGWSLVDGVRILQTGRVPHGTLGLPRSVKRTMHRVIKAGLKTPHLIAGTLIVGVLISLLESFCTGQIYIPTIMIMLRSPQHRLSAILYLVLYNLMFILPLVIILISVYLGVRSQWLRQMFSSHVAALKFTLAGLFVGLGLLLLLL